MCSRQDDQAFATSSTLVTDTRVEVIAMSKTLIDVPDDLMAEAMEALGASSEAEAVLAALAWVAGRVVRPDSID